MTEIKHVTGTAFIVAEFRARENEQANPLYVDRIVPLFLDERTKHAANAISSGFPAAEKNVRIRTRYLDDRLDEQLALGCRRSSSSELGWIRGPCASAHPGSPISKSMT